MSFWEQNTPGLNSRNIRISLRDSYLGFHDFIYYIHSYKMCILILIGKLPYKYANELLGKNFSLYMPMEVWLVINIVMCAHNKLERLRYFSQALSLE